MNRPFLCLVAMILIPLVAVESVVSSGYAQLTSPVIAAPSAAIRQSCATQTLTLAVLSQPTISRIHSHGRNFWNLLRKIDAPVVEAGPLSAGARWFAGFFIFFAYFDLMPPMTVKTLLWRALPAQIILHEIIGHGLFADWTNGKWKMILRNAIFLSGSDPKTPSFWRYALPPLITMAGALLLVPILNIHDAVIVPFAASLLDLLPIPGTDLWRALHYRKMKAKAPSVQNAPLRLASLLIIGSSMIVPGMLTNTFKSIEGLRFLTTILPASAFLAGLVISVMIVYHGGWRKNFKTIAVFIPALFLSAIEPVVSILAGVATFLITRSPQAALGSIDAIFTWDVISLSFVGALLYSYWVQPARMTRKAMVVVQKKVFAELQQSPSPRQVAVTRLARTPAPAVPQPSRKERRAERAQRVASYEAARQPSAAPVPFSVRYIKVGRWIKGDALFDAGNESRLDPVIVSGLQRFLNAQRSYELGDETALRDIQLKGDLRGLSELSYGDRRAFFRFENENGVYTVIILVAEFSGAIKRNNTGNYKHKLKLFLIARYVFASFELLKDISIHIQDLLLMPGATLSAGMPKSSRHPFAAAT
jgi:hypothetical protein